MNASSRTIRLFVSSTFSDMKAERDILQAKVFPRLQQHCLANGLRFQAIDLRWGVPEEAGKDNRTMRICLVVFAMMVLAFALNSESSIFKMVENAYKITLAGAFVPLAFGAFWKRATTQGALCASVGGLACWVMVEVLIGDKSPVPAQLIGFCVAVLGMVAGSLLPQWVGHKLPGRPLHELQAAAATHHVAAHPHRHN